MRNLCRTILVVMLFVFTQVSWAVIPPQAGVEWTVDVAISPSGAWDMGYQFDVDQTLNVLALGAFDLDGDGFNGDHLVGLFTAGGTLLASTTVDSNDNLIGDFRYSFLGQSLALEPGTYVVISTNWGNPEGSARDPWAATNGAFTTADGISNVLRQFRSTTGELNLNNLDTGCCSTSGYFGGNVLFGQATIYQPVPTLGTWMAVLLASMLLLLAGFQFRRMRR